MGNIVTTQYVPDLFEVFKIGDIFSSKQIYSTFVLPSDFSEESFNFSENYMSKDSLRFLVEINDKLIIVQHCNNLVYRNRWEGIKQESIRKSIVAYYPKQNLKALIWDTSVCHTTFNKYFTRLT